MRLGKELTGGSHVGLEGWSGGHAGEIAGEPQLARGGLGRAGSLHGRP